MSSDSDSLITGLGSSHRRLVSVPEGKALRIPGDEVTMTDERLPCPPVRPISVLSEAEIRGHPRPTLTKAEPVTASQQISLWLMRSSAQNIEDWSAVGSLRSILGLRPKTQRRRESVLRKCETDVKFRIESDGEEESDVEDSPGKGDRARKKSSIKDKHGALLKQLARKGRMDHTIHISNLMVVTFQLVIRQRACTRHT